MSILLPALSLRFLVSPRPPTSPRLLGRDRPEPLLDDIDVGTLMNEDDFEIETMSQDGLQGVKQKDPDLRNKGKLVARERQGPQRKNKNR